MSVAVEEDVKVRNALGRWFGVFVGVAIGYGFGMYVAGVGDPDKTETANIILAAVLVVLFAFWIGFAIYVAGRREGG